MKTVKICAVCGKSVSRGSNVYCSNVCQRRFEWEKIKRNYLLDKARVGWYYLGRQGATNEVHTTQIYETFGNGRIDVGRLTEDEARAILEEIRWPEGPVCPHCQSKAVTRIQAKSKKVRDGLFQCNSCRKQFTVILGTVMQGSHITLRQWVQAFYSCVRTRRECLLCSYREILAYIRTSRRGSLPAAYGLL